jgi:hypothetical protein
LFVVDGRTSIDVAHFSPDRFDRPTAAVHLSERVPQSAAVRRRH